MKLQAKMILGAIGLLTGRAIVVAESQGIRKAALGASAILGSGIIGSLTHKLSRTDSESDSNSDNARVTEQEIKKLSSPLSSNTKKDVALRKQEEALAAPLRTTLQFSEDVKQATNEKMVRATGRPFGRSLPELSVKKEYSPLSNNLVLNVNALKSKVEKLETKTFLHTSMLMGMKRASNTLNTRAKEDIEEYNQSVVNLERVRDEENLEGAELDNRFNKLVQVITGSKVFRKSADTVGGFRDTFISFAKTLMLPTALIALGALAKFMANSDGEYDITDQISASISGAVVGILRQLKLVPEDFKLNPQFLPDAESPKKTSARPSIRDRLFNPSRYGPTGSETQMPLKQRLANYKAQKQVIEKMKGHFQTIAKFRVAGISLSLVAVGLILTTMLKIVSNFEKGELNEEEYEIQMKNEIKKLVTELGGGFFGAWLGVSVGMKIGFAAGGAIGGLAGGGATLYVGGVGAAPGAVKGAALGTATGAVAGALIGGYVGTKFFESNPMSGLIDVIVDGIFEYILGNDTALISLLKQMMNAVPYDNEQLIRQGYSTDMSPADMIIRSTERRTITDAEGNVLRTTTGVGVDERGILTALKRIKTPEEYYNVKRRIEEELGEENFENFLSRSLNDEELALAMGSLKENIINNRSNQQDEIAQFFSNLATRNSELFETIMGADDLAIVMKGEGIPVFDENGDLVVMTVDEIRNNLSIPEAQRLRLLEQAEDQRKKYERILRRQVDSNRIITEEEFNNAVSDEMFRNAPQLRTSPDNSQASIVPVVMPMNIGGMGDTETGVEIGASRTTDPTPSSYTSDSFLQTGFGALA